MFSRTKTKYNKKGKLKLIPIFNKNPCINTNIFNVHKTSNTNHINSTKHFFTNRKTKCPNKCFQPLFQDKQIFQFYF